MKKSKPAARKKAAPTKPVRPARPSVKTAPEKPTVAVRTSSTHVEFFKPGEPEPFSRILNGPAGSDAAAGVSSARQMLADMGFEVRDEQ